MGRGNAKADATVATRLAVIAVLGDYFTDLLSSANTHTRKWFLHDDGIVVVANANNKRKQVPTAGPVPSKRLVTQEEVLGTRVAEAYARVDSLEAQGENRHPVVQHLKAKIKVHIPSLILLNLSNPRHTTGALHE